MEIKKRLTAYKLCISQILAGEQTSENESSAVAISLKNKAGQLINVSKVNVTANIIDKYASAGERKYATITLDDATGQIRAKAFGDDASKIDRIEIGDTVLIIGFLRFFNNELYINPIITRVLDPKWLFVRKLELEKQYGNIEHIEQNLNNQRFNQKNNYPDETEKLEIKEEKILASPQEPSNPSSDSAPQSALEILKNKIINKIKTNGKNAEELDIEQLIMGLDEPIEQINASINELLEENVLYEPKPGNLKLL